MPRHELQLACSRFAALVIVERDLIVDAAPIVARFIGQPWRNLDRWARKRFAGVVWHFLQSRGV